MGLFNSDSSHTGDRLGRSLDDATKDLRDHLSNTIISGSERELDRITKYHLYWHFYKGKHWKDFDYTLLSFNYVRAFIDKTIQFLLGKDGFSFKVTSFDSEVVEDDVTKAVEKVYRRQWLKSGKKLLTHELFQMGGICGDAWMGLTYVEQDKYVKIKLFDSRYCFPVFKDGDIDTMESFMARIPLERNLNADDKNVYVLKVIEYRADKIITWLQKDTNVGAQAKHFEEKETKNPYGFIPVVHFKNKPASDGYYSTSDAEMVLKLNKIYNELAQEIKSIIDYYSTPTTIVKGATINQVKKGLGNIWHGLPAEADIFNLSLDASLGEATQFLQMLKTSMHELSDVPENFLGKTQAISNTSAAALQLTFQPIIQQADLKWLSYGEGITELNKMIYLILKIVDKPSIADFPKDFEKDYLVEPVFPYGFPKDKQVDLQTAQMELQMRLNSRKRIMERLGVHNVPDVLSEIEEDDSNTIVQQTIAQTRGEVTRDGMLPQHLKQPPQDFEPPEGNTGGAENF